MNQNYVQILEKQLAIDYGCSVKEVQSKENIFRIINFTQEQRPIGQIKSMLKVAVYHEKLLVMADEKLLDWCMQTWKDKKGTWFSNVPNLCKINAKLQEYGQYLADAHHHYIPTSKAISVQKTYDVKWYERDELDIFRGDDRFDEALLFDEKVPDMLAVCAIEQAEILGMAAVTRDSEMTWQIGVNVTPKGAGKGIGTYVTTLLKEEVLKRGILPTYATAESHIKSQKVAMQAGFEPAFYEVFSKPQKTDTV